MKSKKNQKFIWSAKVNERGQIVIPKQAREVFDINPGDNLLIFGDLERGMAIAKQDDYIQFAQAVMGAAKNNDND